MKKFILTLVAALSVAASTQAGVFSTNAAAAGTHLLSVGAIQWTTLTLAAPAGGATFTFYDNSLKSVSNAVTAAFLTYSSYATNINVTNITTTGVTNVYTNSYIYTLAVTNAASANAYTRPVLAAFTLGSSETRVIAAPGLYFARGVVVVTDSTNQIIQATTAPLF